MPIDSSDTKFPQSVQAFTPALITLDSVVEAIESWRVNKKSMQEPIPESIWQQIFVLLEKFPESTLRAATGISSNQFRRKLQERAEGMNNTSSIPKVSSPAHIDFCEVKTSKSISQAALYKPAKILATNTLIVEFCRADGQIMKIHTTTDSFAELMKAFFAGA